MCITLVIYKEPVITFSNKEGYSIRRCVTLSRINITLYRSKILLCASQNMRTKGPKAVSSVVKVNDNFKLSMTLTSEICTKLAKLTNYSLYHVPPLQCTATEVREELRSIFLGSVSREFS